MPIITKVVSSNPTHGEVYSVQHYVIKFGSDLRQVGGFFSPGILFPPNYRYSILKYYYFASTPSRKSTFPLNRHFHCQKMVTTVYYLQDFSGKLYFMYQDTWRDVLLIYICAPLGVDMTHWYVIGHM